MSIEFGLNLSWWQYVLGLLGIIYAGGSVFFLLKTGNPIFALIWPLFYLIGGVNVQ